MLSILLLRDWLNFQKQYLFFIILWFLFPLLLDLFLVVPLSVAGFPVQIRYINWAAPGVWMATSGVIAFMVAAFRIKKIKHDTNQLEVMLKSPLNIGQIVSNVVINATVMGWVQSVFALFITSMINNEFFSILQIINILCQMIPYVVFFAILGVFLGIFVKDAILLCTLTSLIFLFISFGLGAFIPLENYPEQFTGIVSGFPISGIIHNGQLIIQNATIEITPIILTILMDGIFSIVILAVSYKTFRN